jgi:TM2 domain-containing membrane protein YozV
MKYIYSGLVLFLGSVPIVSNAQSIDTLLDTASGAVNKIIPILIGLALVVFFFGLVKFIAQAGNTEAIADGRRLMLWGIVSLFIMVAIWGIIAFFADSLNIGVGGSVTPPTVDCGYFESLGQECPE